MASRASWGIACGRAVGLMVPTAIIACTSSFDTSRTLPARSSLGTELYGVLCDRMGGQSLHEDLTGASYYAICHAPFSNMVDQTRLPPLIDGQVNIEGAPVPLAQQKSDRAYGVARLQTMAGRRSDLIAALDATFPNVQIPIKDVGNADPTKSCAPPAGVTQGSLHDELSNLLGRFQALYDDGTIPQSTEAVAKVINAFKASPEAQAAWAVYDARAGYRPVDMNLGATRPTLAYTGMRDFANATLALLSADSQPYAASPMLDASGNRVPVPGAAYAQLTHMLSAAHAEMLNSTADPTPGPLSTTTDPITGRALLSRPRQDLELMQSILYAVDPAFGGGDSRYIAQRDSRGYVTVPLIGGSLPPPFVDANGDGLPDVDATGAFVTKSGAQAPSPFLAVGAPPALARDTAQRALVAPGGPLLYGFVDTSHTYTASVVRNLMPLLDPSAQDNHETLMDFLAGAGVVFGARKTGATKSYPDGEKVTYTSFDPTSSPLLDLTYAFGQIMADPTTDDTFSYLGTLVTKNPGMVARLVGDGLYAKSLANADLSGSLPAQSTLWDEMIDLTIQIEQEPGLLEDMLRALGADASLPLSTVFSGYIANLDHISYDRARLNGPVVNVTTKDGSEPKTPVDRSLPDSGANRSEFQRFVQAIHDTNGVTACNKEGAIVHARGLPVVGTSDVCASTSGGNNGTFCQIPVVGGNNPNARPFHECEVFKFDNLAAFYLDSIVGAANLYFRPTLLRDGLSLFGIHVGASTVGIIEQSSGIGYDSSGSGNLYNLPGSGASAPGFWDDSGLTCNDPAGICFHPKPAWLDRLVFFDLANDSTKPTDPNYVTNHFLADLQGSQMGTSVCPERVIADPCAGDTTCGVGANVSSDGKVHGLRACPAGEWLFDRDLDSTFVWEDLGFYSAITPLVNAFATAKNPKTGQPRRREDLFIGLMEVLHKHWQTPKGAQASPDECVLTLNPSVKCTQDGASSYEPLLTQIFSSDMLTAIHDLVGVLQGLTIPTCAAADATGKCTKAGPTVDGISVLAAATRALVDPAQAKAAHLTDRAGHVTSVRNDGKTNPQVTPLYLVLETLDEIDAAFAAYAKANPGDTTRQAQWKLARSQLVDQFLGVTGQNTKTQSFTDPSLPKILPVVLDAVRTQIAAHCPGPPYGNCAWARQELTQNAAATVGGPTFAAAMDMTDAIRQNATGKVELEKLLTYLANAASSNDALAEFLASMDDLIQVMRDDANLVPLYHVMAAAMAPSAPDSSGVVHRGMMDATTTLLSRIEGRAMQGTTEICAKELDPDGVMTMALGNLVTPMKDSSGNPTQTPLEVILEVIGDVNRQTPGSAGPPTGPDLANAANEMSEFFLDPQRGLEQFYAIVRNGTVH